ncbi:FadR/GntR family transcriptional regulator [Actinospica robiniae]|uniref:FadR/GntR family transcriptional regulator n=1 Tax=Actinospica robiniae TaxID=304901 RepID=UPI00041B6482|nr:FadR/GntR family transcriptional regulator [Actinospica robiniae]
MSLTDKAIEHIRELILSGQLPPGSRLPSEPGLAAQLGISRNLMREAVKSLVMARVLEIRRGAGTYVTSLEPGVLLEGLGSAVELLQGDTLLEMIEARRLFEPVATGLAATRISADALEVVAGHLAAMRAAHDDVELLNRHDAAFHRAVVAATGNETLASLMDGIAGRTVRARVWRGMIDGNAAQGTLNEHQAIYDALAAGDAALAQATALMHVNTTETWLRRHLADVAAAVPDVLDDRGDDAEPLADEDPVLS